MGKKRDLGDPGLSLYELDPKGSGDKNLDEINKRKTYALAEVLDVSRHSDLQKYLHNHLV
jgi:hypothetical protein